VLCEGVNINNNTIKMFTHNEKVDMLLVYGEARKNLREAARLYAERYPDRLVPDYKIFGRLEQNLRNNSEAFNQRKGKSIRKSVSTNENVANVLQFFEEQPEQSIRQASIQLDISYGTIQRILSQNKFHDYKPHNLQLLTENDFERRIHFVAQILPILDDDRQLLNHILWTDEARFISNGVPNRKNTHFWADENPHWKKEIQNQGHFGVNVWCGIVGRYLIGPYFFEQNLTGQIYLEFLQNDLALLLEDIPLQIRRNLWLQQDGAAAHNARIVQNYLEQHFRNRWIGTNGPVRWPPKSPDITPMDFFLWGTLKNIVYQHRAANVEELKDNIRQACDSVRNNGDMLRNVTRNEVRKRLQLLFEKDGRHIEHLL
jgi:hypothetical protein